MEPIAHRRADALARVADRFLSGSGKETGGDRYLVHVHTDIETLKADGTGAECEIDEATNVSADMLIRFSSGTTTSCVLATPWTERAMEYHAWPEAAIKAEGVLS